MDALTIPSISGPPPWFIQRAVMGFNWPATEGVNHWRMRCPICQGARNQARLTREPPALIFWDRGGDRSGWSFACYAGRLGCTQAKVRLALKEVEALPGFCPPAKEMQSLDYIDTATRGVAKAQAIWSSARPVTQDDQVDKYLRANGVNLYQQEAKYIRLGQKADFPFFYMVEALVDPYALTLDEDPTILGVAMTFLRGDGQPVLVGPGEPKMRTYGRHRGLACPIGSGMFHLQNEMDVSVGAIATIKSMRRFSNKRGLAVAKPVDLGLLYATTENDPVYRVTVPHGDVSWSNAQRLLTEFERLGVRHDAWEGGV